MNTRSIHRFGIGTLSIVLLAGSVFAQDAAPPKSPPQPTAPVTATPGQPATKPAEPAPAKQPAPDVNAENAALSYERIWDGANKAIFDAGFLRTTLREDEKWLPDVESSKQLEAAQADIESLIRVTKMPKCDWHVRTKEEGFDAKVPHWIKLGTTCRVLFADARRLNQRGGTGDAQAAIERIAAIIRLSHHFESDKLVGAVRTGRQLAAMGLLEAQRLAKAGKLDEPMRKTLLEAIKPLDTTDPLSMKDALLNESIITREWTKRICVGPNASKTFIAKFAPKAKQEEIERSGVNQMDEATLHRQIESLDLCYKEIVANWDLPNAGEAIKSIDEQRKKGDFGGPAVLVNSEPGFAHHRAATFRFVAIVKDVIKSLNEATLKKAP